MSPLCALLTALVLAWTDTKTHRMPNAITLGSLCLAVGMRGGMAGSAGAASAVAGALVAASAPAGLFFWTRGRGIGGGDVKALAAIGAWLGPSAGLELELLAFSLLAGWGLLQSARRGKMLQLLSASVRMKGSAPSASGTPLIFGPSLALAAVLTCGLPGLTQLTWPS